MPTLTLYCRAPTEPAWSRLNHIVFGSETNEPERRAAEAAAKRAVSRYRAAWAHTILPDHEFLVDDTGRWPAPVVAHPIEDRIPEPAL